MNADQFRDIIDRSQIPMTNGPKTDNNIGTEHFTSKKNLPLRQQSSKGILRYDAATTKTGHCNQNSALANRLDLSKFDNNGKRNLNIGTVGVSSESKNASIHTLRRQFRLNSLNLDHSFIMPSPYSRPVSASDIAESLHSGQIKYRMPFTVAVSSLPEMSHAACTAQTLQRNTFLRPLSEAPSNKYKPIPTWVGPQASLIKQENYDSVFLQKHNLQDSIVTNFSNNIPKVVSVKLANTSSFTFAENINTVDSLSNKPFFSTSFANKNKTYSQRSVTPEEVTSTICSGPYLESKGLLMKETSLQDDLPLPCGNNFPPIFCESSTSKSSNESISSSSLTGAIENLSLKKMPVTSMVTGLSNPRQFSEPKMTSILAAENLNFSNIAWQNSRDQSAASSLLSPRQVTSANNFFEKSNHNIQLYHRPSAQETKMLLTAETIKRKVNVHKNSQLNLPTKSTLNLNNLVAQTQPSNNIFPVSSDMPKQTSQTLPEKISPNKCKSTRAMLKKTNFPVEQRCVGDGAPSEVKQMAETSEANSDEDDVTWNTGGDYCNAADDDGDAADDDSDKADDDDDDAFNDSLEEGDNSEENKCNEPFMSGERLPGDGEAYVDSTDDDEQENIADTCLYKDVLDFSKRCPRSMSADSKALIHELEGKTLDSCVRFIKRPLTAVQPVVVKSVLRTSLFNKIPPTINFVAEGEKTEPLPHELSKLLKWKMSSITPKIVKDALARVGFKITKKNHDWLGCFGKHMKSACFKSLNEYQKLNHFPGSFQIGRKDKLWRSLSKLQIQYGKQEFNFFPQTYILPFDLKLLKQVWEDGHSKQKWIVKPPASARGRGICVISKWSQVPKRKSVIVQRYIHRPFLINASKFDMRLYVYVSCYDPLRLYVYDDGLARFASCKYSSSSKSLSNRFIHLTNYSVNKKNTDYLSNTDKTVCEGHKWSLKALWTYMKRQGINTNLIWENIRDLIIKTIISGDSVINSLTKSNTCSRYCCHELFGFDILLDEHYKPWILEVNISPSLHSNSPLDISIKGAMIKDMLNIAGFRLPDEHHDTNTDSDNYTPSNKFCIDKRLFTNQLSPDERAKHSYYCQKYLDEESASLQMGHSHHCFALLSNSHLSIYTEYASHQLIVLSSLLNILTPDDVRILCESIDEDSRKGHFQRLFPTPSTHRYLRYFETPRYYNLLLDQWVLRYNHKEDKGIQLLQSLCDKGIHLQNPIMDSQHVWTLPPRQGVQCTKQSDLPGSKDSRHKHSSLKSVGQLPQSRTNNSSRNSMTSLT